MKHFTIITVVKNAENKINRTLESIFSQDYKNFDIIVIDGNSDDNTVKIINKYKSKITTLISENDSGLFHAMNKGLKLALNSESYILFLNAGDTFYSKNTLSSVSDSHNADIIYGQIEKYYIASGLRVLKGRKLKLKDFSRGMAVRHGALFVKRKYFDIIGNFNIVYKVTADYDWSVRLFSCYISESSFINLPISVFETGGISESRWVCVAFENFKIIRKYFGLGKALQAWPMIQLKVIAANTYLKLPRLANLHLL